MIQLLADRYQARIAYGLFLLFVTSMVPNRSYASNAAYGTGVSHSFYSPASKPGTPLVGRTTFGRAIEKNKNPNPDHHNPLQYHNRGVADRHPDLDGPSQPEMSSFKSVGTGNMVNLFTGDFNYNIPLMDVGGYPINIFYNGGITMEQEASWVGLGWNINPGAINRNMRGIPDDFDGSDTLLQTQRMKSNITWGLTAGASFELFGTQSPVKGSLDATIGISFNNYLGPALELGVKNTTSFTIADATNYEKNASVKVTGEVGLDANLSSRNGLTFSPNVSLGATASKRDAQLSLGAGVSMTYNSRAGIKALQLNEQMSFNRYASISRGISFLKPSYIPSMRLPLTNTAYSGNFQVGTGLAGPFAGLEAEVFKQKSEVANGDTLQRKLLFGYLYYQNAKGNPNAVMDFTRFNDGEVTPHTPIISAPQYAYDIFSIQGEGTGGIIRPYRSDLGIVQDNLTRSQDKNTSLGADVGPPGHFGANYNNIKTPSTVGGWVNGNLLLNNGYFGFTSSKELREAAYFKNPDETTVIDSSQFRKIGGVDLVRYKLGGSDAFATIQPTLQHFSKAGQPMGDSSMLMADPTVRQKRSQVTNFLTAEEASRVGLDRFIKSYSATHNLNGGNELAYDSTSRMGEYRKKNHISQIDVTEADGKRYVYGLPVYNIIQKDFTFTTGSTTTAVADSEQINIDGSDPVHLNAAQDKDGYLQTTVTPAYAHSFLLTGLLSSDYVDVRGDGITEDDLGDAVKFNYSRFSDHAWRTPLTAGSTPTANFNAGNRSEKRDDKGIISYGKRESWYVNSIESKAMIAIFTLENRQDGKGALNEFADINTSDTSVKRLKKIDLYNKADIKKNGLSGAKPIKTVWFAYSYKLCANSPDNAGGSETINGVNVNSKKGKLTLDSIYFTFNGKTRINKNKYVFSYGGDETNPAYQFNAADRWGSYKPSSENPSGVKNNIFPYSLQGKGQKTQIDNNAAAWQLKKVLLPSGGQIEVQYESDDYAYVQNLHASDMFKIAGLGNDSLSTPTDRLYGISLPTGIGDNDYVFVDVPEPCLNKGDVLQKYLSGIKQLAFKVAVNMPKGVEYIRSYAGIADYGRVSNTRIWIRLAKTDGVSPLTLTALEYLREQLPGQAFEGYDLSESSGLKQIGEALAAWLPNLLHAFRNPLDVFRSEGKAQTIDTLRAFVRLNDPDGFKYGGGYRVKSIKLKDNWQAMTGQYTSEYGQQYDYTTTETVGGVSRTISSGVASYEPSIGGEENPFQTIIQVADKLPLGPTSYGAIEMPMLDAFFPSPVVGYSKVTVRALRKGETDTTHSRSGIGKQVSEFYTAKDFPVYYSNTPLDPLSDKEDHEASTQIFLSKYAFDSRTISQGFLVEVNDMHGKMKSQSSYAENDSTSRISYTENFYRNTGKDGLNEKFDFAYNSLGGTIRSGNMGVDVELMTDTREFSVKSTSLEVQGQVDFIPMVPPIWLPTIWPVVGSSDNIYRAITTTKFVNYHGIVDSVVAIDKGSRVTTKNLVYDAETGQTLISRTNNEFDSPVYNVAYPAYWAYSGMGPAYKNIDAVFTKDFADGKIVGMSTSDEKKYFESGDELYISNTGTIPNDSCGQILASSSSIRLLWAFNKTKDTSSLTDIIPDIIFIDSSGIPYNRNQVTFRIIRSGKRNLLSDMAATVTLMKNPIVNVSGQRKVIITDTTNVVNSDVLEFKEKWQTDNGAIRKLIQVVDTFTCIPSEIDNCSGYLEKRANPYRIGLLGNFRVNEHKVFYGNRADTISMATVLKQNGFLKDFHLYWQFNDSNNLVPVANPQWVWNSEITRFNSKGRELEEKNALDIYTGAQYGYGKTLPVAITNNSNYQEMFFEGFEDNEYDETLNNAKYPICEAKHIDFSGLTNATIVNSSTTGFPGHTGKYMLQVSDTATKVFDVNNVNSQAFALQMGTSHLSSSIGGFDNEYYIRASGDAGPFATSAHSMGMNDFAALGIGYEEEYTLTTYIKVASSGSYSFNSDLVAGSYDLYIYLGTDETGVLVYSFNQPTVAYIGMFGSTPNPFDIHLCENQFYFVKMVYHPDPSFIVPPYVFPAGSHTYWAHVDLPLSCSIYGGVGGISACDFTLPIAGAQSMLNPIFQPPSSKKMLFSAWVKGNCASGRCDSYTDNKVSFEYDGGSSQVDEFKPTGPIIDGWQRYEGSFTVPAVASQVTMKLIKLSGSSIYFDDIRIHPFNANMKSYVYDPINLRIMAELDANNYAKFYEYDEEGILVRTKVETKTGVKTLTETRTFQQRNVKEVQ